MPLTPTQKQNLISRCNVVDIKNIYRYIITGDVTLDELPLTPERKAKLDEMLSVPAPPDPREDADWVAIQSARATCSTAELVPMLDAFVRKYPRSSYKTDAGAMLNSMKQELERSEWNCVDTFDIQALIGYMTTHPTSAFAADAEDSMWLIVQGDLSNFENLRTYQSFAQSYTGRCNDSAVRQHMQDHLALANQAVAEYQNWQLTKNTDDIKLIHQYLQEHPDSPFLTDIQWTIMAMKPKVFQQFRENLGDLSMVQLFYDLTDNGIISRQEFINARIINESTIDNLLNAENLPLLDMSVPAGMSKENCTDVFFFGIPSTGKTCLIMGLMGSTVAHWSTNMFSGRYAGGLDDYRDYGKVPPSTNQDFVAVINGTINDSNNSEIKHPVNLIDMAGETFANKIANNPDCTLTFEDMGEGVPEILQNDNDKVFFIVVDPTRDLVKLQSTGNYVSQANTMKRFVDLFSSDEKLMNKVKGIHFIVTKSDMLDENSDHPDLFRRNELAKNKMRQYGNILNYLKDMCKPSKFNINVNSNNLPRLYPFSLGRFYLGGIFDYDPCDSDKIIRVISNSSYGVKETGFMYKLQKALNSKLF